MKYVVLLFVLAVIIGTGIWFWVETHSQTAGKDSHTSDVVATSTSEIARTIPSGWKEYQSAQYAFSVLFPEAMQVTEFDEGEGAATITFQDDATASGFQIFVTPYGFPQVSPERFRKDIPSGVRESPKDITVDGATASSFYSSNAALGDTAEIWFIRDGYLFEVTTLKSLDAWLGDIMQSWKFL